MRFIKSIMIVSISAVMMLAAGCSSEDQKPFFQNSHASAEPGDFEDPFDGLPNLDNLLDFAGEAVSAFAEAFDIADFHLDMDAPEYRSFVDSIKEIVDNPDDIMGDGDPNQDRRQAAFDVLTEVMPGLADDYGTGHGAYGLFAALRNIVGYIINQESLDDTSGNYIDELYDFLDKVDDALTAKDDVMKHDLYQIMYRTIDYLDDSYTSSDKELIMADLQSFLMDTSGQTFTSLLLNLQESMGKLLLRADSDISFDDPLDYDGTGSHNIELGNSVAGVEYLMKGLSDMLANDADARESLYGVLGEAGKLVRALKGSSTPYYPALKAFLRNTEDYFTTGGTYASGADYYHAMGALPSYYVNAELRNTVRELWPGLARLMIRERSGGSSDPDYSIISSGNHQRSPVEYLTMALYKLRKAGINYADETNYAIEPSLKQAVTYNGLGETRSTATYKQSYLDHLLFTIAASYTWGFKTRERTGQVADDEPYANAPCGGDGNSYIHGEATKGVLTVNDTMYSLTNTGINTRATAAACINVLDVWSDSYNLALANRVTQGSHVWRSSSSFAYNASDKANYQFFMGADYPALHLLPSNAAGDVGIPQGGQKSMTTNPTLNWAGTDGTNEDYRTYFPKVADGVGDVNTATWIFSWMARVCWDGAGPYYSTDGALTNQSNSSVTALGYPAWPAAATPPTTFDVIFKPNGEVYAYIDRSGDPYRYYYPVTGNDVADPDTSANGQRYNRYRDICRSDYYMIQNGHTHGSSTIVALGGLTSDGNPEMYCVPPMNPSGSSYAEAGDKFKLVPGASYSAQYFQVYEKVIEWDNDNRDDANDPDARFYFVGNIAREKNAANQQMTQEEAMYRNYQWLMLEKKFLFIIPLNLFAQWGVLAGYAFLDSCAYVFLEGNGVVGASRLTKGASNGHWVDKRASGGVTTDGAGADLSGHCNSPDYGNSLRPGDTRILALAYEYVANEHMSGTMEGLTTITNGTVNPTVVFGLLGNGNIMPDIVGANIGPIARMGFVAQGDYNNVMSCFDKSSGTLWADRNKLLPIIVALAGVFRDGTYYQQGTGHNYNYAGHHKYPFRDLIEGIMIPLGKPHLRLWSDVDWGNATYGQSDLRWVPRLANESGGNLAFLTPHKSSSEIGTYNDPSDYYPSSSLRTLVGFLADTTTTSYGDGLISVLGDGTTTNRLVTKLLALLQGMGNDDADSIYRDDELGILTNVAKGLEQVATAVQLSRGEVAANGYGYLDDQRYRWMFWNVMNQGVSMDRRSGTPISVDLTAGLNELVGDNASAKGLATFIDNHDSTSGWANYDRLLNAVGEMMGNSSGSYYIVGEEDTHGTLVHVINNLLTSVTMNSDDIRAVRHTLGVLMDRYSGGTWVTRLPSGTAGTVTSTTLTDGTRSWTTNEHAGKIVKIYGTVSPYSDTLIITANTATTLSFTGAVQTGSSRVYEIYDSDLAAILQHYLPETMTSVTGYYQRMFMLLKSLLDKDYDGVWDTDAGEEDFAINDYLIDLLIHGNTAGEVIPEMYDLLNSGAMWNASYYSLDYPNKSTLKELVDICAELALEIEDVTP